MKVCRTRLTVCRIAVDRSGDDEEEQHWQEKARSVALWLIKSEQLDVLLNIFLCMQCLNEREAHHEGFTT